MRLRFPVPYPFMASLFPVLALAAGNVREIASLRVLWTPILFSLSAALIGTIAGLLLTADRHKAAVVALATVVVFATYGYLGRAVRALELDGLAYPPFALSLSALTVLVVGLQARRIARDFRPLSRMLNAGAAASLVIPSATLGRTVDLSMPRWHGDSVSMSLYDGTDRRPSVYLVVLDEYTGSRSLRANWGLDNQPFEAALERRGFNVISEGRANYAFTFLSLAALLNWRYLDEFQTDSLSDPWTTAYNLVENNRAQAFFRGIGYRFVFFPTPYAATSHNRNAHLQLPHPSQVTSEFEAIWASTTMAVDLRGVVCQLLACSGFPGYVSEPAELLDWKFRQLAALPDKVHPAFVFAHLMVPHEPYVYDAECRHRPPMWPQTARGFSDQQTRTGYLEQLQCVNRQVLDLVDAILQRSSVPPIILLQSDHGHGRFWPTLLPLEEADPEQVAERLETFGAYYLPGRQAPQVYDGMTPANLFRVVLPRYFDIDLPLLPDQSYWAPWAHVFRFANVDSMLGRVFTPAMVSPSRPQQPRHP